MATSPKSKQRYQDPIVVGRIYGPKFGGSYTPRPCVTFFIAWWLDLATV